MTLKLYKKLTRWYFKYHNVEYFIDMPNTLNTLEKIMNKTKVLYVKLNFNDSFHDNIIALNRWDDLFCTNYPLYLLIILFNKGYECERFCVPYDLRNLLLCNSIIIESVH